MKLRPYQAEGKDGVYNAWDNGAKNVLLVEPTGAGKTVIFSEIIKEHTGAACAIAHRQELVSQISLALAKDGVYHKIIGPKKVVRAISTIHMFALGKSYYDPHSQIAVAGVDTLVRRYDELKHWLNSVSLWVQDEAHHVLKGNKWGKACDMFPNAKGLGVTATPERADGKGLGRHADGLFDVMIIGPTMRDLINQGYLTDYRIFAPGSDLDLTNVPVTASGDYSNKKLKIAVRKSHIVGDAVKHYLNFAKGKLGITFASDVETATDIATQFNLQGIPAAIVSAKTPDAERLAILRKFKNREILMLVNVDLFGEGFDLPAIEVVIMARPTKSYGLYVQQFGRALRLMLENNLMKIWDTFTDTERKAHIAQSTKPTAIIIDMVNNVETSKGGHGLPDAKRNWTLDRRERRAKAKPTDVIPVRACPECTAIYERTYSACPHCGHKPIPAPRSGPEQVDGDLTEITPEILAEMRGEIIKVDMDVIEARIDMQNRYVPEIGIRAGIKRHIERQEMQKALRASIAWWAGLQRAQGRPDTEIYRRFYFAFSVDIMTAQALKTTEALDLAYRINNHIGELANVG